MYSQVSNKRTCSFIKFGLWFHHVRLFSRMFVYFADFFSTMFVYYIMFVYDHGQNNVPYTLRYLSNKQYLLSAGAFLAVALLAVALLAVALLAVALLIDHFKLDMEKDFYIIDIFKFPLCLQ